MRPYSIFLTEEEINKIHNNSLHILKNIGFMMPSQQALEYMQSFGCEVDGEKSIVKIKPDLVQDSIDKAIKKKDFVLHGQIPEHDMNLFDNHEGNFIFLQICNCASRHGISGTC